MARASIPTWLSLDRYAKIMGLPPAAFNQAYDTTIFPTTGGCNDVWCQHPWQNNDTTSREDLATAIFSAEQDIMRIVGYPLAPTWLAEEVQMYPRYFRPEAYSDLFNARIQYKGLKTKWNKIIAGGRRKVTAISLAKSVTFTDVDADGLYETATVTCATSYTNANLVKVYFAGHLGDPAWEIQPARTKAIAAGTFTATFWSWQLCNPTLWEHLGSCSPINLNTAILVPAAPPIPAVMGPGNTVLTVDIYAEENDPTTVTAQFIWEPQPAVNALGCCSACGGTGCLECSLTFQDGCIHVRDSSGGWVAPTTATYSTANAAWTSSDLTICREPDMVKIWYYAGDLDNRYLAGYTNDPLSDFWARMIAMVATARLERPICGCGCTQALTTASRWQEDTSLISQGRQYVMSWEASIMNNPLGSHIGEMQAWKTITMSAEMNLGGAAL